MDFLRTAKTNPIRPWGVEMNKKIKYLQIVTFFVLGIFMSLEKAFAHEPRSADRLRVIGDDESSLKLRNINGNALFSIIPKTGSPLSPTSNYGGTLLYNPEDLITYKINSGSYKRPSKPVTPSAKLDTYGFGGFIQLGDRSSTVTLGLDFNYFDLQQDGFSRLGFFSALPSIGIRIESDAELIVQFEIFRNINARSNLQKSLGEAPTDITVLNSSRMEASLGLGIGI